MNQPKQAGAVLEKSLGNLQVKPIRNFTKESSNPRLLTIDEISDIPVLLTAEQAKSYGFIFLDVPEPEKCQFCNRELFYVGRRSLTRNIILSWDKLEECDCPESRDYMKQQQERMKRTEAEERARIEREALRKKAEKLLNQSKIGERFKTRTFETFKPNQNNSKAFRSVRKYGENFIDYKKQGLGFILSGPYGTGKTHLAAALAIFLINKGYSVVFGTLITLLGKIRQTYSERWTQDDEIAILETFSEVDLLIIDDLGKEKTTEWALEKLFTIVNSRYENNLPIVVTTNYSAETLIKKLTVNGNSDVADSVVSRLNEMCRGIYLDGSDYRKEPA